MLALLVTLALAWTVEVEETVRVSEHELWTSEIPSLTVADGVPWLGFTTRHEGERYATCGYATRDQGAWKVRKDVLEDCIVGVVASDSAGRVSFFAGGDGTRVLHPQQGTEVVARLESTVRAAPSAERVFGLAEGRIWTRHDRVDGQWRTESLGLQDLNRGHPNAITTEGVAVYDYGPDGSWEGLRLHQTEEQSRLMVGTSTSHLFRLVEVDGVTVVAWQQNIGGGETLAPILVQRGGEQPPSSPKRDRTWSEERVGEAVGSALVVAVSDPGVAECPLDGPSVCRTQGTTSELLALSPAGDAVVLERDVQVKHGRICLKQGPLPIGLEVHPGGSTYVPIPRPCLKLGGWGPGAIEERGAPRLEVGGSELAVSSVPPKPEVAMVQVGKVLHLAWYEMSPTGTVIRYVRARR